MAEKSIPKRENIAKKKKKNWSKENKTNTQKERICFKKNTQSNVIELMLSKEQQPRQKSSVCPIIYLQLGVWHWDSCLFQEY